MTLHSDFLDTEDKSVKLVIDALSCLKKLHIHTMLSDIVDAAHSTPNNLEMYCKLNGVDYEVTIMSHGDDYINIRVRDDRAASTEYVYGTFSKSRVMTISSFTVDSYTITEWLLIIGKSHIITNTDDVIYKTHLEENRFQYDTVNPLAGLILDFWGE